MSQRFRSRRDSFWLHVVDEYVPVNSRAFLQESMVWRLEKSIGGFKMLFLGCCSGWVHAAGKELLNV